MRNARRRQPKLAGQCEFGPTSAAIRPLDALGAELVNVQGKVDCFLLTPRNDRTSSAQRLFEMPAHRPIVAGVEAKESKLSFETALGKLESIVESMESGDVPLAELLAKFEEGSKLLKVCESRLKDAELKIEQLKKKDGKTAFEKFETTRDE